MYAVAFSVVVFNRVLSRSVDENTGGLKVNSFILFSVIFFVAELRIEGSQNVIKCSNEVGDIYTANSGFS